MYQTKFSCHEKTYGFIMNFYKSWESSGVHSTSTWCHPAHAFIACHQSFTTQLEGSSMVPLYPKISSLNFCQIVIVDVGGCHVVPQALTTVLLQLHVLMHTSPIAISSSFVRLQRTWVGHIFCMLPHV